MLELLFDPVFNLEKFLFSLRGLDALGVDRVLHIISFREHVCLDRLSVESGHNMVLIDRKVMALLHD